MERDAPWTVRRLLEWTTGFFTRKQVDSPRLSAELLLSHVLSAPRIKLYTDYERVLGDGHLKTFRDLVQRAGEHEPIAYLTGRAHFFNLELVVRPGVLIPRPDTETLVEAAISLARGTLGLESPRVLDLCTGSGCIAFAIAKSLPSAMVVATDKSPVAVETANENAAKLSLADRVSVLAGDLFAALDAEVDARPFDLLLANPPYIPTAQLDTLDRNVRQYEPLDALDGGLDGLALHHRILHEGGGRIVPGGRAFLEIAFDQRDAALAVVADSPGWDDAKILKDYAGNDRVLSVRRKPASE